MPADKGKQKGPCARKGASDVPPINEPPVDEPPILMTAEEIMALIANKESQQIWVEVQPYGDGFIIPLHMLPLVPSSDGTVPVVDKNNTISVAETTYTYAGGNDWYDVDVTSGEIWEILAIYVAAKASAVVANRTLAIQIRDSIIMTGTEATVFQTSEITMSASQYANLSMASNAVLYMYDNGVIAYQSDENILPMVLSGGGLIRVKDSTGMQTGDIFGTRVYYRKVG